MSPDPRVRFGLKLIEIRKTRGWSQERLALESGLARSYLGGVERGQRNIALLNIRAGPVCLDRISTALSEALRGSVIHGGGGRRSVWTVG